MENNTVYRKQFAILAFIASVTFKVVMLPQYLAGVAQNNSYISIAISMAIEIIMYCFTFYVITRINLTEEKNKWLMTPIMIMIFLIAILKLSVMFSETVTYTSGTLFDQGRASFIILGFIPVIAYLVYKGGNSIARLGQIVFWVIVASALFTLLFSRANVEWKRLLPIMPDGPQKVLNGVNNHYVWFGDFIPFLFFSVVDDKNRKTNKFIFPVTMVLIFVAVVLFYMNFVGIYGNTGSMVNFAFNKMAVFNKISELIGPTNFPSIITWMLMSIIKLSLILYTATMSLNYFIKKKWISIAINCLIIAILVGFVFTNIEKSYSFATSGIKYLSASIQYSIPIILTIYVRVKYGKKASQK